jgi:nitrate/nitrite-specific signal transduction histidine kinase
MLLNRRRLEELEKAEQELKKKTQEELKKKAEEELKKVEEELQTQYEGFRSFLTTSQLKLSPHKLYSLAFYGNIKF